MTAAQPATAPRLLSPTAWRRALRRHTSGDEPHQARFAGLFGTGGRGGEVRLLAVLFRPDGHDPLVLETALPQDGLSYPSLSPELPAAFWYERVLHDLFGVVPEGHPRLDPLMLPLQDPGRIPLPGTARRPEPLVPDEAAIPRAVTGPGVFTIPHGPVRSGVVESVEYLVETAGEDIPRVQIRVFHKHRGVSKRFEHLTPEDGVLAAERVEGIASVAHALAFGHAVEQCAELAVPWAAGLVRVLYAELERVANHLDVMVKLTDAAGLAVATARFALHKERLLRLTGRLCGSRYGRGVVVPGGVRGLPRLAPAALDGELAALRTAIASDWRAAMNSPSFLDRLRGTGPLAPGIARAHGALGPLGRASGAGADVRYERPYDAYPSLGLGAPPEEAEGDVMARTLVREGEVTQSFHLLRQTVAELRALDGDAPLRTPVPDDLTGHGVGSAEAPQGETLYLLRMERGRVARCVPRSASFHNLVLFHEVFAGDILTDFPFIEASFGLSIAGVSL
ncbi:NADH-quinone oxidoreductase subunit C [Streptomyces sp. LP11]|uniref:NADH-quinone oxidoreductase subunit C n=1 Tax=Streptomyces pyxinicus TaxID=2970331 RepID=A0ABT2B580_9ACTN|nr:NADH-quinone oxidoreductase subunit C [Streptomyces sp. LP11]MCS0603683.1 NADH-quinone oxidoreductase subunit C [Streptomyces sp. LP11]